MAAGARPLSSARSPLWATCAGGKVAKSIARKGGYRLFANSNAARRLERAAIAACASARRGAAPRPIGLGRAGMAVTGAPALRPAHPVAVLAALAARVALVAPRPLLDR